MPKLPFSGLPPLRTLGRRLPVGNNPVEVDMHMLLVQLRRHRTQLDKTIIILDRLAKGQPHAARSKKPRKS